MDLLSSFIFTESPNLPDALKAALRIPAMKEFLLARRTWETESTWLLRFSSHLGNLSQEDQVTFLERLLPLLAAERSRGQQQQQQQQILQHIIPAQVPGGSTLLKSPDRLLDPHDLTVMAVFGLSGESLPELPTSSPFHFPAQYLPSGVRTHLRSLGLRSSANDPGVLHFLMQHLRDCRGQLTSERYGEVQRTLMQRIMESWPNLPPEPCAALVAMPFVELSPEADGGELPESVFSLSPFREKAMAQLKPLKELVSRTADVDPYVCWMSAPLAPRGFPDFPGYRKPTVEMVVQHATTLSGLADATAVPGHLWPEMCNKVIPALCSFLAASEPFRDALAVDDAEAASSEAVSAATRSALASKLRRTKFLAVPMESSGGEGGPHALVAPWRISLVLREHRPPMFALPSYLVDHVRLLKLLGVRDVLEVPAGGEGGSTGSADAAAAASAAMRWLFTSGQETFADVTVMCADGRLHLHRNILMARSEYFKAMFQHGEEGFSFREGQEGGTTVHLMEANMAVANVLFGFLYHGGIDEAALEGSDGAANAVALLMLADQLGVPHLFEFAQLWIANQQDLIDCADALEIAERHQAELLEGATLSLMAANMDEAEIQQQLPRLSERHMAALMELVKDRVQRRGGGSRPA